MSCSLLRVAHEQVPTPTVLSWLYLSTTNVDTISSIPTEIIEHIASHLAPHNVGRLRATSRKLEKVLFKIFCTRAFEEVSTVISFHAIENLLNFTEYHSFFSYVKQLRIYGSIIRSHFENGGQLYLKTLLVEVLRRLPNLTSIVVVADNLPNPNSDVMSATSIKHLTIMLQVLRCCPERPFKLSVEGTSSQHTLAVRSCTNPDGFSGVTDISFQGSCINTGSLLRHFWHLETLTLAGDDHKVLGLPLHTLPHLPTLKNLVLCHQCVHMETILSLANQHKRCLECITISDVTLQANKWSKLLESLCNHLSGMEKLMKVSISKFCECEAIENDDIGIDENIHNAVIFSGPGLRNGWDGLKEFLGLADPQFDEWMSTNGVFDVVRAGAYGRECRHHLFWVEDSDQWLRIGH